MFDILWLLTTTSTCLVNKRFLIVFNCQTFPVWTGLYDYAFDSKLSSLGFEPWLGSVLFLCKAFYCQCLSPPRCTKEIWVSVSYMQQKGTGGKGAYLR